MVSFSPAGVSSVYGIPNLPQLKKMYLIPIFFTKKWFFENLSIYKVKVCAMNYNLAKANILLQQKLHGQKIGRFNKYFFLKLNRAKKCF